MAFDNHPHQLNLKRKSSPKSYNYSPLVFDRHGNRRWKWDAYYTGISNDPESMRKRDVWELAEYLDARRKTAEVVNAERKKARETRLDQVKVKKSQRGDLRKYPGVKN